jgi:hypothetical protein
MEWDKTWNWQKIVRSTGRLLTEVHRPEQELRRLFGLAGLQVIGRYERQTIDLERFEPIADLLVFELTVMEPSSADRTIKDSTITEAEPIDA